MTFKPYLADLKKKGVTYLAGVTPSKRNATAISIANLFLEGAPKYSKSLDLLIVTSKEKVNKIQRLVKKLPFLTHVMHERYFLKFGVPSIPAIVWIDDIPFSYEISKGLKKIPRICSGVKSSNSFQVLIDSREQLPLFKGDQFKKATLYVGDYTTEKLNDKFFIERKSPMDLYGTLTKGHRRFRDELLRAEFNGMKLVLVVECPRKEFVGMKFNGSARLQLTPTHVEKITRTTLERYGVEVVWCKSREHAKRYTLKRLKEEEAKL